MYSIFLNNNSDAIYTTVSIVLFPNRVLRYEANYICTIILQRLRTESRFSGGGGSQSVCHQPQEPVLVDWPTHDFRQLYQFCQ